MSLTRKLLREMELTDEAIGRILAAHHEAVDALTLQRDDALAAAADHEQTVAERDVLRTEAAAHHAEAERLRTELEDFRQQVHQERTEASRRAALHEALLHAGANEQAIPLLAQAVRTSEEDWAGAVLLDAQHTLAPVIRDYAGFFSSPVPLPTERITPPLHPTGTLTHEDLKAMTAEEINQNWLQVRSALGQT